MRLPLAHPYNRFVALKKQGELSLRKQFCFAFITWGYKSDKKAKARFVELAKEWRKEEGRVGAPRTLLERKARKLFQTVAKKKKLAPSREGAKEWATKSRERKVGVFSPEYQEKLREHNKRIRQIQKEKGLVGGTKDWIVYSPDGEVYHTRGLKNFCLERGLGNEAMYKTNKYPGTTWKGWRAESMDNEWKNL
jgi:hypothetical protein